MSAKVQLKIGNRAVASLSRSPGHAEALSRGIHAEAFYEKDAVLAHYYEASKLMFAHKSAARL
jgi:hypothetical protein